MKQVQERYKSSEGSNGAEIFRINIARVLALTLSLVLSLLISSETANAQQLISIDINTGPDAAALGPISIMNLTDYTTEIWIEGDYQDLDGLTVQLFDQSGTSLLNTQVHQGTNIMELEDEISSVNLYSESVQIDSTPISFCDNDGTCEPCLTEEACPLNENSFSCADCNSGAEDNYCDTLLDTICDPDCGGSISDRDCLQEYYAGPGQEEYIATTAALIESPEFTILPTGDPASFAQSESAEGAYCTETVGGQLCNESEICRGDIVRYGYDKLCCIGKCELQEQGEEEFEEILPIGPDYDEELGLVMDDAVPYETLEELGEQVTIKDKAIQKGIMAEEALENINLIHISGIVLGIFLLIAILIAAFRRSADRSIAQESVPVQQNTITDDGLATAISDLVSKGHSYQQVEQILLQKGFDKTAVDQEIHRDYQRRSYARRRRIKQ